MPSKFEESHESVDDRCSCCCGLTKRGGATAQVYPTHPITVIVPVAAGGITDTVARILGDRMRATLDQPVVVENVTCAGGTIGISFRSSPDGYTLLVGRWTSDVGSGPYIRWLLTS